MKAKTAIKAKNKKKLYLFIPAIVVLLLLDAAAFTLAVQAQNVWLFWGSFVLLALTLIAVWQLASLSKSINKFYQTMEKQLSPYSNKALRDFPLPVLVTRGAAGRLSGTTTRCAKRCLAETTALATAWRNIFPR